MERRPTGERNVDVRSDGGDMLFFGESNQYSTERMRGKTQSSVLQQINERRIMKCIRVNGAQSRAQLARHLSLSFPAVSRVVGRFIDKGWLIDLEESAIGEARNGRPSKLVSINTKGPVAVGVELRERDTNLVLVDLIGNPLRHTTVDVPEMLGLSGLIDRILLFLQESEIHLDAVLGVGITGIGSRFDSLRWSQHSGLPMEGKPEQARLTVPIYVVERHNAAVLSEVWFGQALDCRQAVFIVGERELTAGIALDGIVRRNAESPPTLSHIVANPISHLQCACGRRGCLGVLSAECLSKLGYLSSRDKMAESLERAELGVQPQVDYVRELVEYYAVGITDLCEIIRPDLVVLGGELLTSNDYLRITLMSRLKQLGVLEGTAIVSSKFKDNAIVMGAASAVVQHVYNYRLLIGDI